MGIFLGFPVALVPVLGGFSMDEAEVRTPDHQIGAP